MKTSEFKEMLEAHPENELAFIFPGGNSIPSHAHVTEVGRTEKTFLDCGGKLRQTALCSLQIWVADDEEHRLKAGKLAAIFEKASGLLGTDDPELQIECQQDSISLFSVQEASLSNGVLAFNLETKQTACLATDVCLPKEDECCSGSGCC